jgi:hypothetical protein
VKRIELDPAIVFGGSPAIRFQDVNDLALSGHLPLATAPTASTAVDDRIGRLRRGQDLDAIRLTDDTDGQGRHLSSTISKRSASYNVGNR